MAKKKSSSSKITITKATTVKTPTIKSYTPSKAVNAAKSTLQKTEKARPAAYTSKYGTQITGVADAIANRKGFSYDYTKDALYQNYKDAECNGAGGRIVRRIWKLLCSYSRQSCVSGKHVSLE